MTDFTGCVCYGMGYVLRNEFTPVFYKLQRDRLDVIQFGEGLFA